MGADKRITEMLSSCPDLVNLRLGEYYIQNFSLCFPSSLFISYFSFSFLPSFLPPLFLFLFFSISLSFSFSLSSPPALFPSRNQKEMDAAPREQHREGTGCQKEMIQVSGVLGGRGHRSWQAQRQMPSPWFNLHGGAE